ncbi:uncharacterized protein B0P05DRAFT_203567 [Gilbertella persicaria]|uniref:uncharacterized protein n=1 Tax=Gilbertella persicaria TaxID=101096 RepID=UPI0022206665|nr:uncharacterized protein B0P05DRAFT_203567 [Gilbertella persicaria]KAI8067707.1 hypothetical protein B0P05DRAFT_203567 [Gilbertella persicaria]
MSNTPTISNMDHEMPFRRDIQDRNRRLTLPPISSMDNGFASKSWPPPSTNLTPSPGSTSSLTMQMQQSNILSPPLAQTNEHPHSYPRVDYFTANNLNHRRQASVSSTGFSKAINNSISKQINTADSMNPSSSSSSTTKIETILTSLSTPSSTRSIEYDIEQVIRQCNTLSDSMNDKKRHIIESNPALIRPWLDDMIGRANEVLNALLRLRKHQLAAEHHHRRSLDGQETESWDNNPLTSNNVLSLNSGKLRKRGKRPVFQGRCHSCNISETPEWRRGPDGARTLCNACGLRK